MELFRNGAQFFLSEKCYDNYFLDHNFLDVACLNALLSKGLGLGIIAGSLLVKVPQVIKIVKNKSGAGINMFGVLLDLLAITFHMSYSYMNRYPFSAWGDTTFLALQTATIGVLVLYYNGQKTKCVIFFISYIVLVYVLNSGLTPMKALFTIQSLNIPILLVGKLSQAVTNYRNGSVGQLSAVTVTLLFMGSLARIFTSIQETGDSMMIITFCASTFANGVILAQLLYYWNEPVPTSSNNTMHQQEKNTSVKHQKSKKND